MISGELETLLVFDSINSWSASVLSKSWLDVGLILLILMIKVEFELSCG